LCFAASFVLRLILIPYYYLLKVNLYFLIYFILIFPKVDYFKLNGSHWIFMYFYLYLKMLVIQFYFKEKKSLDNFYQCYLSKFHEHLMINELYAKGLLFLKLRIRYSMSKLISLSLAAIIAL